MTSELKQRLEDMADRGEWRGADTVMTAARTGAEQPLAAPSPMTRQRYGWAVALGAAALVLILIGGVAWWSSVTQHEGPAVDESATTTVPEVTPTTAPVVPVPTTTPEAAPTTVPETMTTTPPVSPLRWTRITDEVFAGSPIYAVTSGGPGLVAIGKAEEKVELPPGAFSGDMAVWVSADGMTWEQIDDPSFTGEPDSNCLENEGAFDHIQEVWNVASGPLGVIATGMDACNGAVWVSEDGRAWTEVIDETWRGLFGLGDVTAGGPGWVIVGGDGRGNGAIWVSENGMDWTAVQDDDLLAPAGGRVEVTDVAAGGPGLVAVGSSGIGDTEQATIWVSADGFAWERLPDDTIDAAGVLFPIVRDEAGERLMVFSGESAWTSNDGINWRETGSLGGEIGDVAWNGDRLVIGGGAVSTDGGATWVDISGDIPEFRANVMLDVTGFSDQIVMVGYDRGLMYRSSLGRADLSWAVWIGDWIEEEGS